MAKKAKQVETLTHRKASRRNIPTAEYQPVMRSDDQDPIRVAYERRNPDLDPQLVWRGKDMATGPISWCRHRRCSSKRRSTPRC